jgi:hypothetical protein
MPHNVSRFTRSWLNNKSTGIPSTLIDDDDVQPDESVMKTWNLRSNGVPLFP